MRTTSTACAPTSESARTPVQHGLTEAEAARRLAARSPVPRESSSRSYASIIRANVLTVFNLILGIMGGLTLAFADWEDALFLGVLFSNSAIGIVQEVRAKRALDRLAALVRATGNVVRDGQSRALSVDEIVVGDLIKVAPGDQIVADGVVLAAADLSLDESVLTGESRSVSRSPGGSSSQAPLSRRAAVPTRSPLSAPRAMQPASPARRGASATLARRSSSRSTVCSSPCSRSSSRSAHSRGSRSGSGIPPCVRRCRRRSRRS